MEKTKYDKQVDISLCCMVVLLAIVVIYSMYYGLTLEAARSDFCTSNGYEKYDHDDHCIKVSNNEVIKKEIEYHDGQVFFVKNG